MVVNMVEWADNTVDIVELSTTINTTVSLYEGQKYNILYLDSYQNQMFIRKAQDEANEAEGQRGGIYRIVYLG
jgi:hypothetical protein